MQYQYETAELRYTAAPPEGSEAAADLRAVFRRGEQCLRVKGFYAGNGEYRIRFLPEEPGTWQYEVSGAVSDRGEMDVAPAREGRHGPVRAKGIHLYHADGKPWTGLGTTVYALMHQEETLIDRTMETLRKAPFTKVRLCVFPKHYTYNHNDPAHYAFRKTEAGEWDPAHPDFAFWDAFEKRLKQLEEMGIQADLILFHPYDRWGFASMTQRQNLVYLDYLVRRFAAFPNVWWSLANEYDLCAAKTPADWEEIETFVAENDPFRHLLGCHNCFRPYDPGRKNITHMSWQTRQTARIPEMQKKFGKPVLIDECCYEGNLPETWGSISGREMTARFWRTAAAGGYCTHGETFYPDETEVVWWARGGTLRGESPARIAFLREVLESLPGPLRPNPAGLWKLAEEIRGQREALLSALVTEKTVFPAAFAKMDAEEMSRFLGTENIFSGICGPAEKPDALLWYLDSNCCCRYTADLPESGSWRVDVLDTWNMTRETAMKKARGRQEILLPGREWMAVLAVRE